MKRWLFVPGASPIDPVANGGIEMKIVASPTFGGEMPMVGMAASRRQDAVQQIPAAHAHRLPVHEWRTQRACGSQWASDGGAHLGGRSVSIAGLKCLHHVMTS